MVKVPALIATRATFFIVFFTIKSITIVRDRCKTAVAPIPQLLT